MLRPLLLATTAAFLMSGCRAKESFPDIGQTIASPVDIAMTDDQQHVFVLNADFDRTYNQGSIITMDTEGNKLGVVKVPRMGRTITVAGNAMLVSIDEQNEDNNTDSPPQLLLFDITDPVHPILTQTWPIGASPFNVVMRSGYPYFALSCLDGSLFIGDLTKGVNQATLKYVRTYGQPRRALYLDTKRELLYGFTTDTTKGLNADQELPDTSAFTANPVGEIVDPSKAGADPVNNPLPGYHIPNEVPDGYENTFRAQADNSVRELYQFYLYDIAHERFVNPAPPPPPTPTNAAVSVIQTTPQRTINDPVGCTPTATEDCHFPWRDSSSDPYVFDELRWVYFRLNNFDGTPDRSLYYDNLQYRFYRTNFFSAEPDPDDPDTFYLSQRGSPDRSPFANQIVRVKIKGDPRTFATTPSGYTNHLLNKWTPFTSDVFAFDRVYGFRGAEATRSDYPGSFKVARVNGQKIVVVNNFRDLVNWVKNDWYFSIGAQSLDNNAAWFAEQVGDVNPVDPTTYYQVVMTSTGRALSLAFYGNAVMLLDVVPGVGINVVKRIE